MSEPSPASTEPPRPKSYEFNAEQSRLFSELANNLSLSGWFAIIVVVTFHAVLFGRFLVTREPIYDRVRMVYFVWPLALIYIGSHFIYTAEMFRKVIDTKGSDVDHLMNGLKTLNNAFSFLAVVPRVSVLALLIAATVGVVGGLIHLFGY